MTRNRVTVRTVQVLLACLALAAGAIVLDARSDSAKNVVSLRVDKVALYDAPNGKKVDEFQKKSFKGSWPVLGETPNAIKVKIDGKEYWVKAYAVKTDKPITTKADCGAVVASNEPKVAGTRGLGEDCGK